ncbi:SGNH/GDSL hydrolase family protein, partial [Streptomyces sp. SCA2-4]|nr:SGNH/GDSL hydrolase family protein [Streptomyces huiliensis]
MTRPPLSRGTACALLAALVAVVTLVSTAIFLGTAGGEVGGEEPRHRRPDAAPAAVNGWTGSWAAAPAAADPRAPAGLPGTSIRNVIHTSVGGTGARIRVSNLFGNRPLRLTHASLAVSAGPETGG